MNYKAIILMGIQGSGKGTQAKMLAEKLGYKHIETGNILREEAKKDTELGRMIHETINVRGELVPPEVTRDLIKQALQQNAPGYIFDGYPRTKENKEDLHAMFNELEIDTYIALDIHISDEEGLKRLLDRRIEVDGKLVRREDDTEEKITKRIAWSHEQMDPLMDEYKAEEKLIQINGAQSIEEVQKEIFKKLEM